MNDAWDYGVTIGLTILIYIGWFALRIALGICIAFVLCTVCDWFDLDVDHTLLNTIVIGLAGISILFPTGKKEDD